LLREKEDLSVANSDFEDKLHKADLEREQLKLKLKQAGQNIL